MNSVMSTNDSFPDTDSDDSCTAEVFLNQFSDNEEDDDPANEHAILTMGNTNVSATNLIMKQRSNLICPNRNSLKTNSGYKLDDFDVCSDTIYSYDDYSSENSDSSYTDSEDDFLESWQPCSKPLSSHRNKNVIPIGTDSGKIRCSKLIQMHSQIKRVFTETKSSTYDEENDNKGRMSPDLHSHKCTSQGRELTSEVKKTLDLNNPPKTKYSSTNNYHRLKANLDRRQNVERKQFSSESCVQNADSQPNPGTASNRSAQLLSTEYTEECPGDSTRTFENSGAGFRYEKETRGYLQREVHKKSYGNSGFQAWNENWTTDDYLLCPNFLLGEPNGNNLDSIQRDGHDFGGGHASNKFESQYLKTSRVPRMFHRRLNTRNKDEKRAESRENRFSDVASLMKTPLTELVKVIKETGIDMTQILGQADKLGLPLKFPCMQCHESAMTSEAARDFINGSGYSADDRCRRCGGQLQTLVSLGKMIAKLRDTVAKNNFEIRDVYPDGNCMFGTVIDQLRVRGDFRYTVRTLRAAVVDYLKENPTAEDGTPLEMFLTNETWEEYVKRMSEDGQWGDHMVLNAITNVLQMCIVIFGGRNGETETVLLPKITGDDSPEAANSKMNGTDISTLYMGHLGETHYVSFRPENWWQTLQEKIFQVSLTQENQKFGPLQSLYVPVSHLDFILRHTINLEHISHYLPEVANLPNDGNGSPDFMVTLVGPIMCKMAPDYTGQVESMAPDINVFFPNTFHRTAERTCVLSVFQTPRDTCVQDITTECKRLNLVTENSSTDLSHVRIRPVLASLWEGQTIESSTGSICLKSFDLECLPFETFMNSKVVSKCTIHRTLAFKSDWPEVANEWISRERKSGNPADLSIQSIASMGCHVVPITSNKNQSSIIDSCITDVITGDQCLWSYSFAVAEMKISQSFSHSQRCCFLLFKALLDLACNKPTLPDALPKSVFFYACENLDESSWSWKPGRCLIILLEKLAFGFRMKFIPHYFISAQNLLVNIPQEHIQSWLKYIEGILKQPVISLNYVLDTLDITSSEIGTVFDDIIEDLPRFNSHRSIKRSFNETIVPASRTLIENLIYQREYNFAMIAFDDIHEEICRFNKQSIGVAKVMNMVLSYMALGYRWCFALYIDLVRGTAVTREICGAFDVVHITEVFGPDIDDEIISNTVVPSIYSIHSGDLKFPSVCADVMLKAGKISLLSKCLRYYIDTYSEIAGENIVISEHTCKQYQLKSLQGLYMTLLETYDDLSCPQKFRELMPNLSLIAELRQSHSGFHDLAFAWETLGEPDMARQCCPCYNRHKSGFLKSFIQGFFGGKGEEYDYKP